MILSERMDWINGQVTEDSRSQDDQAVLKVG